MLADLESRSNRLERRFDLPVVIAALLVVPVIAIEELYVGEPWNALARVANWAIWLTFAAEVVAMLAVVPDRWAWVRHHPLEVAVVILTPPFLPIGLQGARAFRLLRLFRLVVTIRLIKRFFSLEGFRYATVVAAFGILAGGAAFTAVERGQNLNAWDGIWWAITTVTTVGYGDIHPTTDAGRVIAILMLVVGVGYVAMLTAAMAQLFLRSMVEKGEDVVHVAESEVLARIDLLTAQVELLAAAVHAKGSAQAAEVHRPGSADMRSRERDP